MSKLKEIGNKLFKEEKVELNHKVRIKRNL